MKIQDCKERIKGTVRRICEGKGVTVLRERESTTDLYPDSLSMYFDLEYEGVRKVMRISDHSRQHVNKEQTKMISSITIRKRTSFEHIERFINNRIGDIKRKALYAKLDMISQMA